MWAPVDTDTPINSDIEEVREQDTKTSRVRLLLTAALGIAAVVGTTFVIHNASGSGRKAKFQKYVPHSHPDFVNYDAVPVPSALQNVPLCAPAIVQEMCFRFNNETVEHYGNAIDADPNYIHAFELSEALAVSRDSVIAMFRELNLNNFDEATANSFAVLCQEVCDKLVASYPPRSIASHSYVGCYKNPSNNQPVCDVDVSDTALAAIHFDVSAATQAAAWNEQSHGHHHGAATGPPGAHGGRPGPGEGGPVNWETQGNSHIREVSQALDDALNPSATEAAMLQDLDHRTMNLRDLKMLVINQFKIFPVIRASAVDNSGTNQFFHIAPPDVQDTGRRLASWDKAGTLALAVKAKAYINAALTKMEGRQIAQVVTLWFGNNFDHPTRDEIKRVLSGVHTMLGNVDYVYPGDQCTQMTYAYVYPRPESYARNNQGQFVFHLCPYYLQVDDGEKIETLTHEGSHHLSMETDDSQWGGQTMYGRYSCKNTASLCAAGDQGACTAVRRNADSYCYFINDAAAAEPNGIAPAPSPTDYYAEVASDNAASAYQAVQATAGEIKFGSFR